MTVQFFSIYYTMLLKSESTRAYFFGSVWIINVIKSQLWIKMMYQKTVAKSSTVVEGSNLIDVSCLCFMIWNKGWGKFYLKGCSNVSTTMSIFISLSNFKSLCISCVLKRWCTAKSQDVSNLHGFVCIRLYIRISFHKILISLLRHWFGRPQRLMIT